MTDKFLGHRYSSLYRKFGKIKSKTSYENPRIYGKRNPVVSSKWGAFDKMRNEHDFLLAMMIKIGMKQL